MERLGLFDHPYGQSESLVIDRDAHHELAIEGAASSAVLLENNGILPLKRGSRIALVGPLADEPYAMFAGYSFPTHLVGSYPAAETLPKRARTIRTALEAMLGEGRLTYGRGCNLIRARSGKDVVFPGEVVEDAGTYGFELDDDESMIDDAVEIARGADVAIVVLGDLAGLFRNGTVGEGSDATSLELPGVQARLLAALLSCGTPVVLVLVSGRPYHGTVAGHVPAAILATWMPGEGGGEAVARMLLGDCEPSGRLPLSYVTDAGSLPYVYNHAQKSGGVPIHPAFGCRYPFGFGLSYTRFEHTGMAVDLLEQPTDGTFTISLTVHNTGTRAGSDVVQLYVRDEVASVVRPVMQLKGWCKLHLEAGERTQVMFDLPVDMLHLSADGFDRVVEPGVFTLMLGSSAQDIWFSAQVEVRGSPRTLDRRWRMRCDTRVMPC
jgi:beta-glucosidase